MVFMNWKALIVCITFFGFSFIARSAPITYKEIAMLLRNGESTRFILEDTARRKLLQPLTPAEEADLISLGGTGYLLRSLRNPAMIASADAAAAYNAGLAEQKRLALQREKDAGLAPTLPTPAPSPADIPPPANEPGDKPMTLKFTAMDGTPVDLANMRGKVVLIDFWATWCGPCVIEIPEVVAAYNKYHDKGFEIIGISLDQKRDDVLKMMDARGMTWPQYFDGKGWKNEIALSCDIHTLPAQWLVNKRGILVTRQARGKLDEEVEKLLEE